MTPNLSQNLPYSVRTLIPPPCPGNKSSNLHICLWLFSYPSLGRHRDLANPTFSIDILPTLFPFEGIIDPSLLVSRQDWLMHQQSVPRRYSILYPERI